MLYMCCVAGHGYSKNKVASAAPAGTHSDQLAESLGELEVTSNGLPPPRPEPSVAVEVEVVAVVRADDVEEVVAD